MKSGFEERVEAAYNSVKEKTPRIADEKKTPRIGLVLGSGLGGFVDRIKGTELPYSKIEGFPRPTVAGHRGLLKIGDGPQQSRCCRGQSAAVGNPGNGWAAECRLFSIAPNFQVDVTTYLLYYSSNEDI